VQSSLRSLLTAALLAGIVAISGCSSPADNFPPVPQAQSEDYRLAAGDQVRIITFSDEQLTGDFRVNDSGNIALPLLGPVKAEGLTTNQLERKVVAALQQKNLYRDPSVAVEIISYRPVFVLGEVAKPGQYPYQPGMSVVTAVAIAGGFTYRAVQDTSSVVRIRNGKAEEFKADRDSLVRPGDVITIYERRF
jgi:polysaccharide export outer membrane protein